MKPRYFLGADVGGSKTRLLLADDAGQVVGFGQSGPGNHEGVGYTGLTRALVAAFNQAIPTGMTSDQIAGAGFGIGGYDFPSETQDTLDAISGLGLKAPVAAVNDTIIGLLAGSPNGWGVSVVSGTGCNSWGWDQTRRRIGRVTGHGTRMGEGAGASELIDKAIQVLAHSWTRRRPPTQLCEAFVQYAGAQSLEDLIDGLLTERYTLEADAAPLIFRVAAQGDPAAVELIHWAGNELGELANCVIRQLDFQELDFDIVLVGSMFDGGDILTDPMFHTIHSLAPGARRMRLNDPPVIGALLLGMEAAGMAPDPEIHLRLSHSMAAYRLADRTASSEHLGLAQSEPQG